MLTLNQLTAIAESNGVDVRTVERDYVLTHLIQRLSGIEKAESLTFKGGTSLRLVHFHSFRYSADIDFNADQTALSNAEALTVIAEAAGLVEAEVGLSVGVEDGWLTYTGPRNQAQPERVKLDITWDEIVTDDPIRLPLINRYEDQAEVLSLPTYGLTQVTAEKLRCVLQRLQCRDIFDIHRLLVHEGVDVDEAWTQFTVKAKHRDFDANSFTDRWASRLPKYEERWNTEMRRYTSDVPHFEQIRRETERALRAILG